MSEGAPGNSSGSEATHATNEIDESQSQYETDAQQVDANEQANQTLGESSSSDTRQNTADERAGRIESAQSAVTDAFNRARAANPEVADSERMQLTHEDVSELQRLFPRLVLDVNDKDQARRVNKLHTVLGALMNSKLVENQEVTSDLLLDNDDVSRAELDLFMPSQDEVDTVRKNAASDYDERHVSTFNEAEFMENRAEREFDTTLRQLSRAGVLEYDTEDGSPSYYVTAELERWIKNASRRHEDRVTPVDRQNISAKERAGVRKLMHGNKNDLSITDAFKVIGLRGARLLPGMRIGAIHKEHVLRNNATVRKAGLNEFSKRTKSQREGDKLEDNRNKTTDPDNPSNTRGKLRNHQAVQATKRTSMKFAKRGARASVKLDKWAFGKFRYGTRNVAYYAAAANERRKRSKTEEQEQNSDEDNS